MMRGCEKIDRDRALQERNSGLFGTHLGGLTPETVGCTKVLEALRSYTVDCQEDDAAWVGHPRYVWNDCTRNGLSLEHASVTWMLKGKGSSAVPEPNNMIAGESMSRFLSLPLMLGTVSPRRVWHSSSLQDAFLYTSNLKTMVEGREWHKLLACKSLKNEDGTKNDSPYRYWRWHGFLCRYADTDKAPDNPTEKARMVLVHGFGASGAQWQRMISELPTDQAVLAPDLIGFGEAEKPPLTYTQYLWNFYVLDFVKEIAVGRKGWDSFLIGGNSIGGFTSMSVAADDAASDGDTSSSGAPGTGRCVGLTLINSAGQIESREDAATKNSATSARTTVAATMAETTLTDSLPDCSPLPRPVARLFGNGLLSYLRPRIGSICKSLYPTNPSNADENLANTILRDSLDPGAINVMVSGSKLPPPRTANELLAADFGTRADAKESKFNGPVLVAQGFLDPLNDSPGRAKMFGDLRDGITVAEISGGHCPHDELPSDVAKTLTEWMTTTIKTECVSTDVAGVVTMD